jgi:quercetin dioxygenase-like cupin family protein
MLRNVETTRHTKERFMLQAVTWDQVELERMSDTITRQMLNGEHTTVARIVLTKGAVVPRHHHPSEQLSMILEGSLRFTFDDREVTVRTGEMLFIPANVRHAATALENTVNLDIFGPRRDDWVTKDDAYLRG